MGTQVLIRRISQHRTHCVPKFGLIVAFHTANWLLTALLNGYNARYFNNDIRLKVAMKILRKINIWFVNFKVGIWKRLLLFCFVIKSGNWILDLGDWRVVIRRSYKPARFFRAELFHIFVHLLQWQGGLIDIVRKLESFCYQKNL